MSNEEKKDYYADAHVGAPDDRDYVQGYDGDQVEGQEGLKRGLKSRHIAMISIGGVIGTG